MNHFTIRLAGLAVSVAAPHPETKDFCADYLCEAAPDFAVEITQADIERERLTAAREAAFEGRPAPDYSDALLETTAVYRQIAERLPAYGAWVFHGSAIAVHGEAYLFTAKSGTGKSTHTRFWRQLLGAQAVMLNDDKPILRVDARGTVWVYGTPWDGKHHLSTNAAAPLCGLAILERGAENEIALIPAAQAWPMLLQQSYRPADPAALRQTMTLLDKLTAAVPLYRLRCNRELDAARLAYETMNRTKGQEDETEP